MTVGELIQELQKHPENLKVLREDNSGGYEGVVGVVLEDATELATKQKTKAVVIR